MITVNNPSDRGGFSLVELVLVSIVFAVIVSASLGFMTVQNKAFHDGSDRLLMLQNLRYSAESLEMDLRTLGSNVPAGQPGLILADHDVIAFSADHTSNVNDFSAVYFDRDALDSEVQAPLTGISLPNSTRSWPDTVYKSGGGPSDAELIIFSFHPDGSTARTDDYLLLRQVNGSAPEVMARNLLQQDSVPFLTYYRRRVYTSETALDSIPGSDLPLYHSAKIHGSPADTAASAKPDSVRAVRINFRATNGRSGDQERFMDLSRVVDLPNAGVEIAGACGDEPILDSNLRLSVPPLLGGEALIIEAATQYEDWIIDKDKLGWMSEAFADVLEDVIDLLEDALDDLKEVPPDTAAAGARIQAARDKIQLAITNRTVNLGQGNQALALLNAIDLSNPSGDGIEEEAAEWVPPYVLVEWDPSVDEGSGEEDVVRYLIYRRDVGLGEAFGNPIVSIPAGEDAYVYEDTSVEQYHTYQYTHAAQDCTPSLSAFSDAQQIQVVR